MRARAEEPSQQPRQSEAGITMIELVVGLSVLVLLVAAALTGVATHQAQRRVHGELILAMSACRNTMEQLRSVPIDNLPSYDGRGFDVPGLNSQPLGLAPVQGDPDGLPGEISVTVDRTNGIHVLYRVQTRVRWQGATRNGSFLMESLMGERR
jgi:type II secretory pathway pseudopilin PulG